MLYSRSMASEPADKPQRVFFALWPDASMKAMLAELAREIARESGGRPTTPDLIHLTLAFLGEQPAARVEALRCVGIGIRAAAFTLTLDAVGSFPRARIAWLGADAPQPGLAALHGELAAALRVGGFAVDQRPYAPHLTLARRSALATPRRLPQPICWRVNSFVLVESELRRSGAAYRAIAEWSLATA